MIILLLSLLFEPVALGYPKLEGIAEVDLAGQYSDQSTLILQDSVDSNIYYIPPKRLKITQDEETQKPLFKISYTPKEGAEFFGVLQLGFDPERVTNSWSQIQSKNPNALLKTLPLLYGTIGVELHYSKQAVLLGYADVVDTSFAQGQIPFYIKLSPTGMEFIRLQLHTEIQSFLALRFQYKTRAAVELDKTVFQFDPRVFFDRLIHHEKLISEWKFGDLISEDSFRKFLMNEYDVSWKIIGSSGDFDLRMMSRSMEASLETFIVQKMGNNFRLKSRSDLLKLDLNQLRHEDTLIESGGRSQVIPIWGSAGVLLSGICRRFQDLVYQEKTGEPGCLDFPLADPSTPPEHGPADPDDAWKPPF